VTNTPNFVLSLAKLPLNKTSQPSTEHCQNIVLQAKNVTVRYHVFYSIIFGS